MGQQTPGNIPEFAKKFGKIVETISDDNDNDNRDKEDQEGVTIDLGKAFKLGKSLFGKKK